MAIQDLEALQSFYGDNAIGCGSLFDTWERGDARGDSVTPSTYCARYRTWMLETLERRLADTEGKRVLSVGCGNAVIEAELQRRGCSVFAIDALPQAVELARRKGVDAVVADASVWEPPHRRWDVIYADGFLGHLYDREQECLPILRRFRSWLEPTRGVVLVSNDAPPDADDVRPAKGVHGFHWLSTAFIARQLERTGFAVRAANEFAYERPCSGRRLRAVVTAGAAR